MPDWVNEDQKILVECKGVLSSDDRKKALLVKKWFPDWLHIFVFGKPHNKIKRTSKTTYASWCDANDIPWLDIAQLWESPECLSTLIQQKRNG